MDLENLKRLAQEATPGEWTYGEASTQWSSYVYAYQGDGIEGIAECEQNNAAYIAAADPQTVLALIAEVERLLQDNLKLSRIVGRMAELMNLDNTEAPVTHDDVLTAFERFVDQADIR